MEDAPWFRLAHAAGLAGLDGSLRPTIFAEMTSLAAETGSINLGQGFPDFDGPEAVLSAAKGAIDEGLNQYGPARGNPLLIEAIRNQRKRDYGIDLDVNEILVTVGATEAISASLLAYVAPGDEVIAFEPYYDEYLAVTALAGGTLVSVPLYAPEFQPEPQALEAAITPRTKAIILNTPHNPTGAVFEEERLRAIATIANRHGIMVIADEVYEQLTFSGKHVPMVAAGLDPELSIAISSGGKTFSVTGWKVGWIMANAKRIGEISAVKQYMSFVGSVPLQPAIATGLGLPQEFFDQQRASFTAKRDMLVEGLQGVGMTPYVPDSGYFVLADTVELGYGDARSLAYELPHLVGVVSVPVSPFASIDRSDLRAVMRFAFCKRDDTIAEAVSRLAGLRR
ncbi:MAG TPA: aminotransferase class I/II-fold pyridoxal phosphate-dependent enzyme [Candidatus Agrococcus pullicola]|uniref:Aminotransferase class I/II-fold pyridoxal phosphate-dependent enzyme n=1 Tax=Candidatus Agrococcus pullicola TaxID=2838429 RepID=A0A9D1YWE7_9MICO|nr:aminotransferase class I/II-fold pyridoxal phosphate-dependent enzyme [Candidatus Agrococcus pullicola]